MEVQIALELNAFKEQQVLCYFAKDAAWLMASASNMLKKKI